MRRDAFFIRFLSVPPGCCPLLVEQPPAEAGSYRFESVEELKLELVPMLLARGMTQKEVADLLGLTIAQVKTCRPMK